MKIYNVIVSASNVVNFESDSLAGIRKRLSKCQGQCSIYHNGRNREMYYGTVEQVRDAIKFDIDLEINRR